MGRYSFEKIDEATNEFGKKVVRETRSNITRTQANAGNELWRSIGYRFEKNKLSFFMLGYGAFVDRGVTGHGRNRWKGWQPRGTIHRSLSDYSFKIGPVGPEADGSFRRWIRQRGIQIRDKKGRYVKASTASFLIRRSVGYHGIKPRSFFTDAWNKLLPEYDRVLNKVVTKEVENNLDKILEQWQ